MNWRSKPAWAIPLLWIVGSAVGICVVALIMSVFGLRINLSHSAPIGFYREAGAGLKRDQYIIFCLRDAKILELARRRGYVGPGRCAGGAQYLLKKIAALPGDTVTINSQGVWVNGQMYPMSRPMQIDGAGRPLPNLEITNYQVKPGELLPLSGTYAASFDGRYFGVISTGQVRATVLPVLTW